MKRFLLSFATAAALIATAGCSSKAQNDTAEAADSIAADANATTRNAVNDVDAASDRALGAAQSSMDNMGAKLSHDADKASDATGNALVKAGDALKK